MQLGPSDRRAMVRSGRAELVLKVEPLGITAQTDVACEEKEGINHGLKGHPSRISA
jgi:hypothetical protein